MSQSTESRFAGHSDTGGSGGEFGVWELTAPPVVALPMLAGSIDAEVGIIGAGYTGLSTALHLADRGIEAVVIEAHAPGHGASGRNAGWMQPDWWHKRPADIVSKYGRDTAVQITRWLAGGPELLATWVERYSMSTGLSRCGLLQATAQPAKLPGLRKTIDEWRSLGANTEFVDAEEVSRHVAAPGYCGGAYFRDGAIVNPLALSRELARASVSRGVRVFANSPVTSVAHTAGRWTLATARGSARVRRFVLATDAYTDQLWPSVTNACASMRIAVLGSEPYAQLGSLLPTGRSFADLNMANMFSLRPDTEQRLVTSTLAPSRMRLTPAAIAEPVMRKFRRVFPGRAAPEWRHVHTGVVGISSDLLPRLCRIGEQGWTAYGYSGAGVNAALLMGGELARRVAGEPAANVDFPVSNLDPLPLRRPLNWMLEHVYAPVTRGLVSRLM